jgi:hypothetical protein
MMLGRCAGIDEEARLLKLLEAGEVGPIPEALHVK